MARLFGVFATWLALLASAVAADPPASPPAVADSRAPPAKEVTIDPNTKEPTCRLRAPTGSRIAKQSCETPSAALNSAEREQLRRDLEEMRMRQTMRDQARAAAELDALRRRAGL